MGFIIGQPIPIRYYTGTTGQTVLARIVDEIDGAFGGELTLVENAALNALGYPGFYENTWTPDVAGHWKVLIKVAGVVYGQIFYYVGGGLTLQEKADVEAEAVDALESFDLDHLLAVAHPTGDPVADAILDLIMNKGVAQTFDRATDSLEAMRDIFDARIGTLGDVPAVVVDATTSIMSYIKMLVTDWLDGGRLDQLLDSQRGRTHETQDKIIYILAEDQGTTEITDDGTSPALSPQVSKSAASEGAGEADPSWVENYYICAGGNPTILSIFYELHWQQKYTAGGASTNTWAKWQISGDAGVSWVDVTDNVTENNVAYQNKTRIGVGVHIADIDPGVDQLMLRLVAWTDDGAASVETKIRSDSYIRLTYRKVP